MELHDIFPPVEIVEYSLYYFLGSIISSLLLLYIGFRIIKRKKRKDTAYYLNILEECNLDDTKHTAYKFTYYGKYIIKTEIQKEQFYTISQTLRRFKYERDSSRLPQNIQNDMKQFLHAIRKENV